VRGGSNASCRQQDGRALNDGVRIGRSISQPDPTLGTDLTIDTSHQPSSIHPAPSVICTSHNSALALFYSIIALLDSE